MINNNKLLALIPARGGSKRLPRKNILDFCGKPLIAWTIEAALKSKYVDHVVVSTNDNDISNISSQYGADVRFTRPNNISQDHSTSVEVVEHALKKLEESGCHYEYVILLQPTSPFRTSIHIDAAVELLVKRNSSAIISVTKTINNPLWANTIPENGSMDNFIQEDIKNKRSQDLPIFYELNGAIYLINSRKILEENTFFLKKGVFSYEMDRISSIDIDTNYDFLIASLIAENNAIEEDR
jgi:CMP-N,N'-diacetyllegionaminic acid synthase